jgi:AcrR family transcriptional regulator
MSSLRDRNRQRAREDLLDAGARLFRAKGFDATTTTDIAAEAQVSRRTFFRYFPTKADVLVANWQEHAEALRASLAESSNAKLADAVCEALIVFADRVQAELGAGLDSVVRLYRDRAAGPAIARMMLELEHHLSRVIARRTARSSNDFAVRLVANASVGVFRAAVRARVSNPSGPAMSELVSVGMRRLRPCFAALTEQRPE